MSKYLWLVVGILNAALFFVQVGQGEPELDRATIAFLAFYLAFVEWETEGLRSDVKRLSERLGWSA